MEYFRERFIAYLDEGGPVEIAGLTWPNSEVFKGMAEADYDAHFSDWLGDQRQEAKERVRAFLTEYGCLDRFNTMMARHKAGYVLPFVGAGMSMTSGHQRWADFLLSLLADAPAARDAVQAHLALDEYEEAAQRVIEALGGNVFDEEIHNKMGSHRRICEGPVCLMPSVFQAEVFTTNFDYVLDHVYRNADLPFARVHKGSRLRQAAQNLGNDPHCLIRLHGEADDNEDRVLTLAEYDAAYAEGAGLKGAISNFVGARSLLFMGCSLHTDRTFSAFKAIKEEATPAIRHYAFLPFPGDDGRHPRRANLGEAEIHPIYYPANDHDQSIEDLLIAMMEGGF